VLTAKGGPMLTDIASKVFCLIHFLVGSQRAIVPNQYPH
jgi:hypothetical protein